MRGKLFGLVGWRSVRFHQLINRRPLRRRQFAYAVFSGATHEVILIPSFEISICKTESHNGSTTATDA